MGRFGGFGGSGLRLIVGFMSGFEVAKKNAKLDVPAEAAALYEQCVTPQGSLA